MKKSLLVLFFAFLSLNIFSQEDAWVYFTDKPDAAYYLSNPLEILSQRALDRRSNQGISLENSDVPIAQNYIDQVTASTGITVMAKSKWLNALHVRGSQANIQALTAFGFVSQVKFARHSLNTRISNPNENIVNETSKIGQTKDKFEIAVNYNYGGSSNQVQMLNTHLLHQQNFTGQGKIIAILDAGFPGVNTQTPFQRLRDNNLILGGYNFPDRNNNFYTRNQHGTMVLSTMGGYVDNQLVGTAPDAQYYLFITEDTDYPSYTGSENPVEESYWVEALEMADSLGVDVVNSSLGYGAYDDAGYSYTYAMRDGQVGFASRGAGIAMQKGIVCVVSAGNEGNSSSGEYHIGIPADASNILTVGSVTSTEAYSSFSSIGPSADGRVKPDVAARGSNATLSNSSGTIITASGTSFSSPILAGSVASFWSALPNLTAAQVIDFVKQSADQFTAPDIYKGYGVPDFQLALTLTTENFTNNADVKIYPNPFTNVLTIYLSNNNVEDFSIYNQLGQKIFSTKISSQNNSIDLSNLNSGVYFYEVANQVKGKLIKK
ncbi:S8 family serine peptidase [Flavobacterium haoranii]|nr:S8 family serine peptidase [Flavobacterium haoranii]